MTRGTAHAQAGAKSVLAVAKAVRAAKKGDPEAERLATEALLPIIQDAMRHGAYAAACEYAKATKGGIVIWPSDPDAPREEIGGHA